MDSNICYTGNGCYGYILGCIVRPTFFHGNLACTSSHSLWQRHVSHSHFPPRRWCFLGLQLNTLGRRGALAVLAQRWVGGVIWTPQKERIALYACFYFLIRGCSIRPCSSHNSCSGNLQSQQKRVALKADVPDMLRSYVLPKALSNLAPKT